MGNLTGNHIDFIGIGNRDDHVGVFGTGSFKNIGARGMADGTLHIKGIGYPRNQFGGLINDGDVVIFHGQLAGDTGAHLSGAADDYFHVRRIPFSAIRP